MSKDLSFAVMLDIYGPLLSEKQLDMMDLYYNEDLSLSEIAQNVGITRQGVRDAIKKAERFLLDTEEKMKLAARSRALEERLERICGQLRERMQDLPPKEAERWERVIQELEQTTW